MKILNGLFITIITILVSMSVIALIALHWNLRIKYTISFTPDGINRYLSAFGQYATLFAGTIATVAAYFGMLRLKAATDANRDKTLQDRYSDWKTVMDVRFLEIERRDPVMKREFVRLRYNLFRQLHALNFTVTNRDQLVQIFSQHFENSIVTFEELNERQLGMGGIYPNNQTAYSFDSFQFLILGSIENCYPEARRDLLELYLAALPPTRAIDAGLYHSALINYRAHGGL